MEASPLRLSRCLPVLLWLSILIHQLPLASAAPAVSSDSANTHRSDQQPSEHRRERPSRQVAAFTAQTARTLSQVTGSSSKGSKSAAAGAADAVRQQGGGLGKSKLDPQGPRDEVRSEIVTCT